MTTRSGKGERSTVRLLTGVFIRASRSANSRVRGEGRNALGPHPPRTRCRTRPYSLRVTIWKMEADSRAGNYLNGGEIPGVALPWRGCRNPLKHLFGLVNNYPHGSMPDIHELLADAALQEFDTWIEEPTNIDQHNGIETEPQPLPGDGLKQLLEGSASARESYDGIGFLKHHSLAPVKIINQSKLGKPFVSPFQVIHEAGHHADDLASSSQRTIS